MQRSYNTARTDARKFLGANNANLILNAVGPLIGFMNNPAACIDSLVNMDWIGVNPADAKLIEENRDIFTQMLVHEVASYATRFSALHSNNGKLPAVVTPADMSYQARQAVKATRARVDHSLVGVVDYFKANQQV